jgi:hypothetical protein
MQSSTSTRTFLNYAGIFILIAGMCTGEFIYWRSLHGGAGAGDEDPLSWQYDSRVYQREIAVNVGTFGLIMDKLSRSASSPGSLAIIITVVSVLAAGGCFFVASRLPRDD